MIEAVLWMAAGSLLTMTVLIGYAVCHGVFNDDDWLARQKRHQCHHKWQG